MTHRFNLSRWQFAAVLGGIGVVLARSSPLWAISTESETSAGKAISRVQTILEHHIAKGYAPEIVALLGQGDEAHVVAAGKTAQKGFEPMQRDSIFRIASMTKPVTAAATMMLIEERKLRLDEPVDRLLPELAYRRVLKRIDAPLDVRCQRGGRSRLRTC